jgi:putative selenate reductase FAD-binding subunit
MATIGGDIATGGKKTGLTPCLIALKANVVTSDRNRQPIEQFIQSGNRDLILKITLPEQTGLCRINQYLPKANATALIRVAVSMNPSPEQELNDVIIAIGAIEDSPRRLKEVEVLVSGKNKCDRSLIEQAVAASINPAGDILGSIAFKKYIAGITVADCIMSCLEKR